MIHYGDITKLHGYDIPAVDVITGGSPCQDLSIAGKREGFDGERSVLFLDQIRIIKEMRERDKQNGISSNELCRPRYMVWENVPGAFSSRNGEDFKAVLEETIKVAEPEIPALSVPEKGWPTSGLIYDELGGWSVAWRVHDARFWGVPQRRRRISLVADFAGLSAGEILFERKGLCRYSSESKRKESFAARRNSDGSETEDSGRGQFYDSHPNDSRITGPLDTANSVAARYGTGGGNTPLVVSHVLNDQGGQNMSVSESETGTLRSEEHGHQPIVVNTYDVRFSSSGTKNWRGHCYETDDVWCLDTGGADPDSNHGGIAVIEAYGMQRSLGGVETHEEESPTLCAVDHGNNLPQVVHSYGIQGNTIDRQPKNGGNGTGYSEETVGTLNTIDRHATVYSTSKNSFFTRSHEDECETLVATDWKDPQRLVIPDGEVRYVARRITPVECARLQGYPEREVYKLDLSKMTKDEYIAWNLEVGNLIADTENGTVYVTRGPGGIKLKNPREIKGTNVNGYKVMTVKNGDVRYQCRIHRIIWIAENGLIPDGMVVDHINSDKTDNRISNLQLLTPEENSHKAYEDGLYLTGKDNPQCKLSPDLWNDVAVEYLETDKTIRDLAKDYGISKTRIHQIVNKYTVSWTDIGEWKDSKGKKQQSTDARQYKALGNSIALPYWKVLAKKITAQYDRPVTIGSLFDGLGGFVLAFMFAGAKCKWVSEIEEFPIAVTKKHFGDEETGEKGDFYKFMENEQ